jgi:hypothetical protein
MTILRGIPRIIQPRLLYNLAKMGHGDEVRQRVKSAHKTRGCQLPAPSRDV